MKVSKYHILVIVLSVVVLLMSAAGCEGIPSPGKSSQSASEGVTDDRGTANVKVKGRSVKVVAVDDSAPEQAIADVRVRSGEQQGITMLYSADGEGKYFPQLTFLGTSRPEAEVITMPLTPVSGRDWTIGEPFGVEIDPESLPEVGSIPYKEMRDYIIENFPETRSIVFMFTEEVADIESSTVVFHASPFSEVVYAHIKPGQESAGLELVPRVNAFGFTAAAVVSLVAKAAAVCVAAGPLCPIDEILAGYGVKKVADWYYGRKGMIRLPYVTMLTIEEAKDKLHSDGFNNITVKASATPSGYAVDLGPDKVHSQKPIPYLYYSPDEAVTLFHSEGSKAPESNITKAILRINTKAEWVENNETATIEFYISTGPQVSGTAQYDDRGYHRFVNSPGGPQTYGNLTGPGELLKEVTVRGGAEVGVQELTFDVTEYFQENGITTYYIAADNSGPALAMFYCLIFYDTREQKGLRYPYGKSGDHQAGLFGPPHPWMIEWGRNQGSAVEVRMDPP
ncbi:hypothetical protein ACFLYM_01925 [Chloroflexota bacterium]